MAQRPTADFNIDPNITSGTDLANILNRFQDAIDSGNSGASRPAYLDAGGLWVQTGNPMRLFFYDGTSDRELFNTTDGVIGIDDGTAAGQVTTWNGSAWTPDSALIVKGLSVGISNDNPTSKLSVCGDNRQAGETAFIDLNLRTHVGYDGTRDTGSLVIGASGISGPRAIRFDTTTERADNVVFDQLGDATFSGKVGIGMAPLRSTAKEQLEVWQSRFDAQIEADPKADKKALTLEITDNAFDALPTEAELAEWMEGRAAGDALQVAGNGSFTGTVNANQLTARGLYRLSAGGFRFTTSGHIVPVNASGSDENDLIDIGENSYRFSDAYFAGTVTADILSASKIYRPTVCGLLFGGYQSYVDIQPTDGTGNVVDGQVSLGRNDAGQTERFKDGHFSGTVNANQFVDASGPIISAFTMVEAFRKIKNAVADETTVEGIKESLTNVLGGLIEEFESIGTQES